MRAPTALLFLTLAACTPSSPDPEPTIRGAAAASWPTSGLATASAPAPAASAAPCVGCPAQPPPAAAPPPGPAPTLELAFVGDIMFGRFIEGGFAPISAELHDPFAAVADLLRADLTMANLETPVVHNPPAKSPWGTRMRFVTTPVRVATLARAGIRHVTIANNHADDMRRRGLTETVPILRELGITAVGGARTTRPLFRAETVEIRGWKIAFVAAATVRNGPSRKRDPEVPYADERSIRAALTPVIARARADHDLVIAVMHWGGEYQKEPVHHQVRAAHAFIDAGADAVIGHHPHVLQPIERYKHGIIAYSLGNFVFDNPGAEVTRTGVLRLRYRRDGRCLAHAEFHPAQIVREPIFHPEPATGDVGQTIRSFLIEVSRRKRYRTTWIERGNDLELESPACQAVPPGGVGSDPH